MCSCDEPPVLSQAEHHPPQNEYISSSSSYANGGGYPVSNPCKKPIYEFEKLASTSPSPSPPTGYTKDACDFLTAPSYMNKLREEEPYVFEIKENGHVDIMEEVAEEVVEEVSGGGSYLDDSGKKAVIDVRDGSLENCIRGSGVPLHIPPSSSSNGGSNCAVGVASEIHKLQPYTEHSETTGGISIPNAKSLYQEKFETLKAAEDKKREFEAQIVAEAKARFDSVWVQLKSCDPQALPVEEQKKKKNKEVDARFSPSAGSRLGFGYASGSGSSSAAEGMDEITKKKLAFQEAVRLKRAQTLSLERNLQGKKH